MQAISLPYSCLLGDEPSVKAPWAAALGLNLPAYQPDGSSTHTLLENWYLAATAEKYPVGGKLWVFVQDGLQKECVLSLCKIEGSDRVKLHLTPLANKETNTARLLISVDDSFQIKAGEDAGLLLNALDIATFAGKPALLSAIFFPDEDKEMLVPNNVCPGFLQSACGQLWRSLLRCIRVEGNGHGHSYDLQLEVPSLLVGSYLQDPAQQEVIRLRNENRNLYRLQALLRRSMTRLKVLAEYSPDVIMQFDQQHRHLFVNKKVEELTPWRAEEYIGKTHEEIGFPDDFCLQCSEALDIVFRTGNSHRIELHLPSGGFIDWFLIPELSEEGEVLSVITTARDITEQKLTEQKLLQNERRLKDAFKVTMLSSWEYELASDLLDMSEEFRLLLGMSDEDQLNGTQYMYDYVLEEDLLRFKESIRSARKAQSSDFQSIIDYRIRRKTGDILTILVSIRVELDEESQVTKLYGTCQNITQLRMTELELEKYRTSLERLVETRTYELRRSEAKLADALRIANLGTWEYDTNIGSFSVSDEVLEMLGTTPEIEEGNFLHPDRVKSIIHPDDYESYRQAIYSARDAVSEQYSDQVEARILHTQGEWRTLLLSIRVNRTRSGIRFFGTLQDITSIRKVEEEKGRLNGIIESTTDIVAIARPDGSITYLNASGRDFFGIQNDKELQRRSFFSFQSRRAPRTITAKELKQAEIQGVWSGEHTYLRFDGVEVPVSQLVIAHKNGEGQVAYYSTILRDISSQKRIEEDLIFKNNELDTFLYRASHDLRGPIATLMGLYNVAKFEITDEKALSLFDLYNSQVGRLNAITVTLIELTKIKEREFEPASINFRKLVQHTLQELQQLKESQDVLFHYDVDSIDGFVSDEHLLHIILSNLVENSIKYKRGDVDSFVKVEVRYQETEDRLVLKVSDNGMGIDPAVQGKIFHMFFRGNERSNGSGLGLYVLKNAVEKLGGEISVYSVPNKGTTFKVMLPPLKIAALT